MTEQERHLFRSRQYNALADCMSLVLHNTKPEHIPVIASGFLRLIHALAMKSSNIQIGRVMNAAGIPSSTSSEDTRRT